MSFQNFVKKIKILESIVYISSSIISTNIFGGREIVQRKGEILPKVSEKFGVNLGSSNFHQNYNSN